MPSQKHLPPEVRGLTTMIALAIIVCLVAVGCTKSTVLESGPTVRTTTTTLLIRPVPNGGAELPDAPSPDDTATSSSPTTPTTAAATPGSTTTPAAPAVHQSTKATHTAITSAPTTRPAAQSAQAATSATPKAAPSTTTTAPTPSTTTTTILPTNPANIVATASPSFAVQGATQVFEYALSDPTSGPAPTVSSCTGVDYVIGQSGGYVLAPFQTTLSCSTPGEILRTLPADAPLGAYDFCVTVAASTAAPVCTAYYVISFAGPAR
jgi:hypothetical protein